MSWATNVHEWMSTAGVKRSAPGASSQAAFAAASGSPAGRSGNGDDDEAALYVQDMPVEWKEEDVHKLHVACGLNTWSLTQVRILARKFGGETGCAILKYTDAVSAAQAMATLHAMPVECASGTTRELRIRQAAPPKTKAPRIAGGVSLAAERAFAAVAPQSAMLPGVQFHTPVQQLARQLAMASGATPAFAFGSVSTTAQQQMFSYGQDAGVARSGQDAYGHSVYVSDVPVEFTEQSMQAFCSSLGLQGLQGVKMLPRKREGLTGCTMLRFGTVDAASAAVARLDKHPVNLATGAVRYLAARPAAEPSAGPARRAPETLTDAEQQLLDGNDDRESFVPPEENMPSVYVSDLPGDITEDGIRGLISEVGLDPSQLVSVKFLPSKIQASAISAMLKYQDIVAVQLAISALAGHEVMLPDGFTRTLKAKIAEAPQRTNNLSRALSGIVPPSPASGGGLSSDLYLSEVPVDWTEQSIQALHVDLGLNPTEICTGIKILPRRHKEYPTGAAILHYVDHQTAFHVQAMLNGQQVQIPGGSRTLVCKMADPPRKMVR